MHFLPSSFWRLAALAAITVATGAIVAGGGGTAVATTFRPSVGGALSNSALGANADFSVSASLAAPDSNFGGVAISFTAPEMATSPVTLGQTVGYASRQMTLGLLNQGCFSPVTTGYRLYSANIDNSLGNMAPSVGSANDPSLNFTEDDGDIDNNGSVDNAGRAGNGIPDGAEWYPAFLNGLFANQTPTHRYFGWQTIPGTPVRDIVQIVAFDPGDLLSLPAIPSSELLGANLGTPTAFIAGDPSIPSPQVIEDSCSPLATGVLLCGRTDADPDDPASEVPDCDVDGGSEVRGTNPSTPGTYTLRTLSMTLRDADGDGIESAMDPCPFNPSNPDTWDPRAMPSANQAAGADNDADNLPNNCDPAPDTPNNDYDGDGWNNRADNCPLVANADYQLDMDITSGAVPDGGPPMDNIGPQCDPDYTNPNGHYHFSYAVGRMCLGGTDLDGDGVCNTYPGENDMSGDSDGDGVLDPLDNCIARANAPLGSGTLPQMSPDINGNGVVQIDDITYVAGKFGKSTGTLGYRSAAEVASQNGFIQIDDITAVAGAFGRNC